MRKAIIYPAILSIGILTGFAARSTLFKGSWNGNNVKPKYTEKREGQNHLVNPLLACDAAEEIISSPEIISFRTKVEKYISDSINNRSISRASVYFRELNDGIWFSIGETETFVPASLRKVPLMIALLKQAERGKMPLNRQVAFNLANDYNTRQNIKPSDMLIPGKTYSVRELIYRMIVFSDNNAYTLLAGLVDPLELDYAYAALSLQNLSSSKDDYFLSVQTYESFFRALYNASYLSREASDWALETLSRSEFKTGLVAGVPTNITVAHKFGENSGTTDGTTQLHDCGIVYYPKHPYLLCIMSQGASFEKLDDVIAGISHITYVEVNNQVRAH